LPRKTCFNYLIDFSGGLTAYLGPSADAQSYFERQGFYFDPMNNPADILMDVLSGKGHKIILPDDVDHANVNAWIAKAVEGGTARYLDYEVSSLVDMWRRLETSSDDAAASFGSRTHSNSGSDDVLSVSTAVASTSGDVVPQAAAEGDVGDASNHIIDMYTFSLANYQYANTENAYGDEKVVLEDDGDLGGNLNAASLSHQRLRRACIERGANPFMQLYLAHNRSMLQQYRKFNAFTTEVFVASISGMVMGMAIHGYGGQLYQGVVVEPYTLISPSPTEMVLPILCLIVSFAVGLAGAPAGVKIFSEEKEIYWREASAGHSPVPYYLGKNMASIYRLVISSLHFTAFLHFLGTPNIPFVSMYLIHLLHFFCVYGLSYVVAMMVKRENAALIAVCITIVMGVLGGGGPTLRDAERWGIRWLLDMSFDRWAAEAWYSTELLVFEGVYEINRISADIFGYTLGRYVLDLFWMLVAGVIFRIVAFFLLILLNRQKQR
jgi:hypothetical protein